MRTFLLCWSVDDRLKQGAKERLKSGMQNDSTVKKKLLNLDTMTFKGEKGLEYVAAIIQRNNPHLNEIISLFDVDITMFNELKP